MQKKITIPKGKNRLVVSVSDSRSIEIIDQKGNVIGSTKSENITAPQIFHIQSGEYKVVTDGKIDDISIDAEEHPAFIEIAYLRLTSDARDFHVVDGIGEISADGKSFATITIKKVNAQGEQMSSPRDNDEIFLRTNAGIIKNSSGNMEIRSLKLKKGENSFRLYSEERKRVATVQVISANPLLSNASISIEFY